jgi:hypothetical protein
MMPVPFVGEQQLKVPASENILLHLLANSIWFPCNWIVANAGAFFRNKDTSHREYSVSMTNKQRAISMQLNCHQCRCLFATKGTCAREYSVASTTSKYYVISMQLNCHRRRCHFTVNNIQRYLHPRIFCSSASEYHMIWVTEFSVMLVPVDIVTV